MNLNPDSHRTRLKDVSWALTSTPTYLLNGVQTVSPRLWRHMHTIHVGSPLTVTSAATSSFLTTAVFERLPQQPYLSSFSLPDVFLAASHHAMARLDGAGVIQPSPLPLVVSSVLLSGALTNVYCAIRGLVDGGVLPCLWAFEVGSLLASLTRTCDAVTAVNIAQKEEALRAAEAAERERAKSKSRSRERSSSGVEGGGGGGTVRAESAAATGRDNKSEASGGSKTSRLASSRTLNDGSPVANVQPAMRGSSHGGIDVIVVASSASPKRGRGDGARGQEHGALGLKDVIQRLMFDVGMTLLGSLAGKGQRDCLARVLLAAMGHEMGTLLMGDTGHKVGNGCAGVFSLLKSYQYKDDNHILIIKYEFR